jgi:hypothetical protein
LRINLNAKCTNLTVKILFSRTSTSMVIKSGVKHLGSIAMVEFYGDLEDASQIDEAQQQYLARLKEYGQ